MNRRKALKQLAIISGGLMLVPACDFTKQDILEAYKNLKISDEDKNRMARLCSIIIPSGENVKGADELAIEDFVLVMLNDCYSSDDQNQLMSGFKELNDFSKKEKNQNFLQLSDEEGTDLVLKILDDPQFISDSSAGGTENAENIRYFMEEVKKLTIQGYMTSEYIMTGRMPYQLVPGKYEGRVKIEAGEKVNIYA